MAGPAPQQWYAVATGDIAQSNRLSAEQRRVLPAALREVDEIVRAQLPEAFVPGLGIDVFRGDSWQMLIADWPRALRVVVLAGALLASHRDLRGVKTRAAIAIGPIEYLPAGRVSEGSGPAYTASGRALDRIDKRRPTPPLTVTFEAVADAAEVPELVAVTAPLADAAAVLLGTLTWQWTAAQALAVVGALRGRTQKQIAEAWPEPTTQQAVAAHLRSVSWRTVADAMARVETALDALDSAVSAAPQ